MDQVFNNREIASAIWLLVLFMFVISKSEVRTSIKNVIKSFFGWHILILVFIMLVFIILMLIALDASGFWDLSMLKITIYWLFGTAFILLLQANEVKGKKGFFQRAIFKYLTLVFVLGFIINIYTFPLWFELLALYGTTKAALSYLTKSLSKETKNTPILVGALRPGMVATKLITEQYNGRPEEWERSKRIFNILSDRVETVTPWLAKKALNNKKTV